MCSFFAAAACKLLSGHVQAGACTGKAASNFNGPTNHSTFGFSGDEFQSALSQIHPDGRKIQRLPVVVA